jgi:hypothetical protein
MSIRRKDGSILDVDLKKSNCSEPLGIRNPLGVSSSSTAGAHAKGSAGDRFNHRDDHPLEAKPVLPRRRIKDPQTSIGANARPTKGVRDREGLKTQAPLLPGNRYSKEESLVIERLSEYDMAHRRFLCKAITWNMADRKPVKHSVPVRSDDDSLNLKGGVLTDDYYVRLNLKREWADFLYSLNGLWDWYGHLTFKDPVYPESADKLFNVFMNKLNREIHGKRFKDIPATGVLWAKAIEKQKRDVLHFHFLCGGIPNWVQRTDYWQWWFDHAGRNEIVPYEKERGAGYYMSKYVGKEGEIEIGGNTKLIDYLEVQESLLLR